MDTKIDYFDEQCINLIEKLKDLGFSSDQARDFFPEAASNISFSAQFSGIEQTVNHLLSDTPSELIGTVHIEAIANKLGVNSEQVISGFGVILPVLTQAIFYKISGMND